MIKKACIFTTSVIVLLSNIALAADYKADLVLPIIKEISLEFDHQLTGYHGKKVKSIIDHADIPITYQILPHAHAFKAFSDGKFACITPDSKVYYEDSTNYLNSKPISTTDWVIVQRKGTQPIISKDQLKGLKVGSYYSPEEIVNILPQSGITYDVKANLNINLLKVALKRIDVAVLPITGLEDLIKNNNQLSNLTITLSPPIATVAEAIMCHDDEYGQKLIKQFNKVIKTQSE